MTFVSIVCDGYKKLCKNLRYDFVSEGFGYMGMLRWVY